MANIAKSSVIPAALIANLPQLILTLPYFTYNNLFTGKLVMREWVEFAQKATPVRVTYPASKQRSTYFLNLPYRYALPLQGASTLLQWLLSQSLFVTSFTFFGSNASPPASDSGPTKSHGSYEVSQIGYSCIAIVCSIVVGLLLIGAGWVDDLRRYPSGMPHVGTCSVAIAAACHVEGDDREGMVLKPLKWGVVSTDEKDVAHCSFSDDIDKVRSPEDEELCR